MKHIVLATALIALFLSIGCIQPKYGINAYNEKNNTTNYYLISYGGLVIPGKWNRDTRLKNSNEYPLIGPDSTNRFFITIAKPKRSILGFSPYTESYNYIKSELTLSADRARRDDLFSGDSTSTFEILESDSIKNFIISRYTIKRGKLTTNDVILNGIKKKMMMNFQIVTSQIDSIHNPKIWDLSTQKNFLKKVFEMN